MSNFSFVSSANLTSNKRFRQEWYYSHSKNTPFRNKRHFYNSKRGLLITKKPNHVTSKLISILFNDPKSGGCFITALIYEISFLVSKNIVRTSEIFLKTRRNFVSSRGHVMFYLINKPQLNTKLFPLNITFRCERRDFLCSHSTDSTVILSRVKISCFCPKVHGWFCNKFGYSSSDEM